MNMNTCWLAIVGDFSVCSESYGYVPYRYLEVKSMKLLKKNNAGPYLQHGTSKPGWFLYTCYGGLVLIVFEPEREGKRHG